MKNKLLALTLALLMLVTAIPAGAIGMVGVESADEVGTIAETAEAEVLAVKTDGVYKPGLNFLTGTTNAETFSDYTVTDNYGTNTFPVESNSVITSGKDIRVTSDGAGNNYAEISFPGADWSNGGVRADAIDTNFGRPAYFFVMAKHVGGGDPQLNVGNKSLIGSVSGSTNSVQNSKVNETSYYNGWRCYALNASPVEPQYAFGYNEWNTPNQSRIFSAYFQYSWNESGTETAKIHWDNLTFVPYYKVTYKNIAKDGTTGTDTVRYFLGTETISVDYTTGAINGLPSTYTVDTSMTFEDVPGYTFEGWSTTSGATEAMAEVTLENEDIVLYPVWKEIVVESDPIKTTGEFKPGLNFLTGTTNAETFNGFTATEDYGTGVFPANSDSIIKSAKNLRVISDGSNKYADVAFAGGDWTMGGLTATADESYDMSYLARPAYVYVMAKHSDAGGSSLLRINRRVSMSMTPGNSNTLHSDPSVSAFATKVNGYYQYELCDPAVAYGADEWCNLNKRDIFNVNYQYSWNAADGSAHIYFDNLAFVPFYKVTYTGADTVKYFLGTADEISVDVATGEITGLPTSYTVDASITLESQNGFEFVGWSTTNGATQAMTEVALENEDIVLYPVYAQTKEYSFVSAEGDYTFYTVEATPENFTFPTAADLGVKYEPRFSDGTGIYYSGMSYAGNATEFEVYNSYVVFAENFEDEALSDAEVTSTYDFDNYDGGQAGLLLGVGEYNGGKAGKAYFDNTQSGWKGSTFINTLALTKAGVYTIKFDMAVVPGEGGNVPTTEIRITNDNLASYTGSDSHWDFFTFNNDNRKKTIEISFKLYRNASGKWEAEMLTGAYKGQTRSWTYTPDAMRISYNIYSAPTAGMTFYYDNFTCEYVPYAPTAVEKTSFRSDAPAGIRFASYVADDQKNQASCYGYVVAAKATLGYESNLTLDGVTVTTDGKTFNGTNTNGVKVVGAVAYNGDNIDKVFATNGSVFGNEYRGIYDTFFTGVLMGIDANDAVQTSTVFVARPFIKIGDTYYYGDCYEASYNSVVNAAE